MRKINDKGPIIWNAALRSCCLLMFGLYNVTALSQIISVNTVQDLGFGAFTQGTIGGTVVIQADGSRTTTGTVVGLGLGYVYYQAIFEVEAQAGTIISITNGPGASLTGSNGGSMTLEIGSSDPNTPFISGVEPPGKTQLNIGGVLTVGNPSTTPPGSYSGTFYVTFNNE